MNQLNLFSNLQTEISNRMNFPVACQALSEYFGDQRDKLRNFLNDELHQNTDLISIPHTLSDGTTEVIAVSKQQLQDSLSATSEGSIDDVYSLSSNSPTQVPMDDICNSFISAVQNSSIYQTYYEQIANTDSNSNVDVASFIAKVKSNFSTITVDTFDTLKSALGSGLTPLQASSFASSIAVQPDYSNMIFSANDYIGQNPLLTAVISIATNIGNMLVDIVKASYRTRAAIIDLVNNGLSLLGKFLPKYFQDYTTSDNTKSYLFDVPIVSFSISNNTQSLSYMYSRLSYNVDGVATNSDYCYSYYPHQYTFDHHYEIDFTDLLNSINNKKFFEIPINHGLIRVIVYQDRIYFNLYVTGIGSGSDVVSKGANTPSGDTNDDIAKWFKQNLEYLCFELVSKPTLRDTVVSDDISSFVTGYPVQLSRFLVNMDSYINNTPHYSGATGLVNAIYFKSIVIDEDLNSNVGYDPGLYEAVAYVLQTLMETIHEDMRVLLYSKYSANLQYSTVLEQTQYDFASINTQFIKGLFVPYYTINYADSFIHVQTISERVNEWKNLIFSVVITAVLVTLSIKFVQLRRQILQKKAVLDQQLYQATDTLASNRSVQNLENYKNQWKITKRYTAFTKAIGLTGKGVLSAGALSGLTNTEGNDQDDIKGYCLTIIGMIGH